MSLPCPRCGCIVPAARPCPQCGHDAGASGLEEALPGLFAEGLLLRGPWPADARQHRVIQGPAGPLRVYSLNRGWWRDLGPQVQRRAATLLDVLAPLRILPTGDGAVVAAGGLP